MEGFLYNVCTFYNIQKNYFHCVFLIFGNESQKVTIKDVETWINYDLYLTIKIDALTWRQSFIFYILIRYKSFFLNRKKEKKENHVAPLTHEGTNNTRY